MAEVSKLIVKIGADTYELEKGVKRAGETTDKFGGAMKKLGGIIAGAFSVAVITRFVTASFKAYDVAIKAEQRLLTALGGRISVQRQLLTQASQLQKITLFGDEETVKAQALVAAFVKEGDQIKALIPLIQDMATAKQMDLASTADLVTKTFASSTNALQRYGLTVEGAAGSAERLDSIMTQLNKAFGGQAVAAAKADAIFTQLKNKWGDFQEAFANYANSANTFGNTFTSVVIDKLDAMSNSLNNAAMKTGMKEALKFFDSFSKRALGGTAEEDLAAVNSELEVMNSRLEDQRKKYQIATREAEENHGKKKRFWEDEKDVIYEALSATFEYVKLLNKEKEALSELPPVVETKTKSLASMNEQLIELKAARETLDVSDKAELESLTRQITILEEAIAYYDNLGRSVDGAASSFKAIDLDIKKVSEDLSASNNKIIAGLDPFRNVFNSDMMAEYDNEVLPNAEEALNKLLELFRKKLGAVADESEQQSDMIKQSLVSLGSNIAGNLGYAIGSMQDFADSIANLSQMILESIGEIMIAVGLKMGFPAGIPLILGGLAMKFGAGLIAGNASRNSGETFTGTGGSINIMDNTGQLIGRNQENVFKIRGGDLYTASFKAQNMMKRL